jgi:selenocysteine-specific elongation factor
VSSAGVMPPTVKELAAEFAVDEARTLKVAGVLVVRGDLVKVAPDLFFARAAVDDLQARLVAHLTGDAGITAAAFRDLIAASRKYVIPLLDYFDRTGLTVRVGDVRRLRRT